MVGKSTIGLEKKNSVHQIKWSQFYKKIQPFKKHIKPNGIFKPCDQRHTSVEIPFAVNARDPDMGNYRDPFPRITRDPMTENPFFPISMYSYSYCVPISDSLLPIIIIGICQIYFKNFRLRIRNKKYVNFFHNPLNCRRKLLLFFDNFEYRASFKT